MTWWWWTPVVCLLLYLLLTFSPKFNYFAKFTYLYLAYIFLSLVILVILLPRPRNPSNGELAARILRMASYPISLTFTIDGEEKLHNQSAAVLLLNHQSSLDLMSLMEIWPIMKMASPVAKRSLLYTGAWFGLAAWLAGVTFIQRGSKEGRESLDKLGEEARTKGTKLVVFPEGTRNPAKDLALLPFKKGAFHVALNAGLPILPVVISPYDFLDHETRSFLPGKVRIRVLDRIETDGYSKESMDSLVKEARDVMSEAFCAMAKEGKAE